jgi:DNA-binding transcriptional LysR family regulator
VHEHARALVAAGDAAQTWRARLGRGPGILRLDATVAFSSCGRRPHPLLALHREVEVHLSTDERMVDVVEGGFDVVFRIGRLTDRA